MRHRFFLSGALAAAVMSGPALLHAGVAGVSSPVLSPPLKSVAPITGASADVKRLVENRYNPKARTSTTAPADPARQTAASATAASATGVNFDGVGVSNSAPPDTNGSVGRNHYMQSVNSSFAIWDKQGNLLYGPAKINTLFQSLGGTCAAHNDGDPIADYDAMADRWVLSQFAVGATDGSFTHQCTAVSQTGDPLGAWYLYDHRFSIENAGDFADYPHMGIWPDGYYFTTHQFETGSGQGLYVLDRQSMLAGLPAGVQFKNLGGYFGALPADPDSLNPPPAGAPMYIVSLGTAYNDTSLTNNLKVWKVKATWGASPSLDVTGPTEVGVTPFNDVTCKFELATYVAAQARPCIPQPPPATPADWLDSITDRLLYRAAYRYFPNGTQDDPTPREVLVLNHTVNAGAYQHGVRWYELRNPGGAAPVVHQQSTWTGPLGDQSQRWMGSIAMDNSGNMLLGYTKSDLTLFPEMDVAGRLATDPLNTLGTETLMKAGGGVQTGTGNRWGDYAAMAVDIHDGCTFWFTSEYIPSDGQFNWKTRVASFKFPSCAPPAQGKIEGLVTDCATGRPLSRAMVQVSNGFSGTTGADGRYSIILPPGSYTVNASAPGRLCNASSSQTVNVTSGGTASAGFCVSGAPLVNFRSYALDDSGGNGNGSLNRNECVKLNVALGNDGCAKASNLTATLTSSTPGLSVSLGSSAYPELAMDGSGTNLTPFLITADESFVCGTTVALTLTVQTANGPRILNFTLPSCESPAITQTGSLTPDDAQQAARMGRDSNASSCASSKACPGALAGATGTRSYDAYTYTNASSTTACITVELDGAASCSGVNEILSVAYLDAYDPQNLCTNYLADLGSSPSLGYRKYSFQVPPGHDFVVVVDSVSEGGTCGAYTLKVSGLIDNASRGNGACASMPDARDDAATTDEETPVKITVLTNDSDGGSAPLTLLRVGTPAHGSAVKNSDGTVTYTPAAGFNTALYGVDSFTYDVSNGKGFTDTATVKVTVNGRCSYTFVDQTSDFEAGAGGWTVETAKNAGTSNWQVLPDPTAANPLNHAFFTDDPAVSSPPPDGAKDDRLVSPAVFLSASSRLEFDHRFNSEDTYDGGVLEVSTDGGATWSEVTAAGGRFLQGGYTSTASGFNAAWSGMNAAYPLNDHVIVDVGALLGENRRFRFHFVADGNTGIEGWHVDNVRFTQVPKVGECRPIVTVTCLEDDAAQIEYSTAWHLVSSTNASGGHFRLHSGNAPNDTARLAFSVPAGKTGAVVYNYAKSTKGGSAQLYVDGALHSTINYAGANGGLKDPEFGFNVRVANLAAGNHVVELRSMSGAVYLDGFCLETASSTSAPAAGPGQTTSGSSSLIASQTLTSTLNLTAGTKQLSVVAEAPAAVPIKLLLVDSKGKVLATADGVSGIATLSVPISSSGAYLLKTVNVSLGPVQVWTASTPLVTR